MCPEPVEAALLYQDAEYKTEGGGSEESRGMHFVSYIPTNDYELCVNNCIGMTVDACIPNFIHDDHA